MSATLALGPLRLRRRAAAVAVGASFDVGIVRDRQALDALAPDWSELSSRAEGLTLFQGLGWARAVFDFAAAQSDGAFDPVIVTLSDGPRLVALLPLERVRESGHVSLMPLGHVFGQYADALVAPEIDARDAVRQMIKAALTAAPCDVVRFLKVRDGSALRRGLPDRHIVTGIEQGAPFVDLGAFADYDAYFQTLKSKTRKNMRNARNRLEREGAVTHEVAADRDARLQVIARTLDGRAERLKTLGLSSRAFRDAGFVAFCRSLVDTPDIQLTAFSLRHRDQPIAEQWGFVHQGHYYAFIASRDFSNSEESPGKLHLGEVLHAVAESGVTGCDLGVPAMPYKLTWATRTVNVRDYALPVTAKGLAIVWTWDVLTRPVLKKLVLAMPKGLRTSLMKLVGLGG